MREELIQNIIDLRERIKIYDKKLSIINRRVANNKLYYVRGYLKDIGITLRYSDGDLYYETDRIMDIDLYLYGREHDYFRFNINSMHFASNDNLDIIKVKIDSLNKIITNIDKASECIFNIRENAKKWVLRHDIISKEQNEFRRKLIGFENTLKENQNEEYLKVGTHFEFEYMVRLTTNGSKREWVPIMNLTIKRHTPKYVIFNVTRNSVIYEYRLKKESLLNILNSAKFSQQTQRRLKLKRLL